MPKSAIWCDGAVRSTLSIIWKGPFITKYKIVYGLNLLKQMTDFTVKNKVLFLHVSNIIFPFITLFTYFLCIFLEYAEINEQTTTTDNEEHHFFVLSSLF